MIIRQNILHRLRFGTKITLGVTLMLVFCGLGIGLILSTMSSTALLEEGKKRGMALTSGLAFRLAEPMLAIDFLQMKNFIDTVHRQYDDIYVFLTDASDNILSHTFTGGFPTELLRVNVDGGNRSPCFYRPSKGWCMTSTPGLSWATAISARSGWGLSRRDMDAQISPAG